MNKRDDAKQRSEHSQSDLGTQEAEAPEAAIKEKQPSHLFADDLEYFGKKKRFSPSLIIYCAVLFVVVAIVWAHFSSVNQSTVAEGRVIPSQRIQTIQSFDGGVITRLSVKRGDFVKRDQIVVQLDGTRYDADYKEAIGRRQVLLASIARLHAQAQGLKKVSFPREIISQRPDLVRRENILFDQKVSTLQTDVSTLQNNHELLELELKLLRPLVQEGLVSQVDMIRLKRETNDIRGQIQKLKDEARNHALTQLNDLRAQLESLDTLSVSLKDKSDKTSIRSPISGVVKDINVHTLGGVIKRGEPIMEIVPIDDELLIEAKVNPSEVAFIHPGQPVTAQLSAYDFAIYGLLKGEVKSVGADTLSDEKGNHFYHVLIKMEKNYLQHGNKKLEILTGMNATVHIVTGKRTILNYILKPIFRAKRSALGER